MDPAERARRREIRDRILDRTKQFRFEPFRTHSIGEGALPTELFHYTTSQGLLGILGKQHIWASDSRFLNDSQEWLYGAGLFRDELFELLRKEQFQQLASDLGEPLLGGYDLEEPVGFGKFVVSFSEEEDLLSQWMGYADNTQGYCIGFDASRLRSWAFANDAELIRMQYDAEEQKVFLQAKLSKLLSMINEDAKNYPEASEDSKVWLDVVKTELRVLHIQIATRFKHPSFEAENEWRLLVKGSPGDSGVFSNRKLNHRAGRGRIVPYLELDISKEYDGFGKESDGTLPIQSITCGPSASEELALAGLDSLLRHFNLDGLVEPKVSQVPYRV